MKSFPELSRVARQMKHAAPQEWDEFLHYFATHVDEVTVAVTDADAATILVEQGKARHARALHRLFVECDLPKTPPKRPT